MTDANQDAIEAAARALYALNPIELAGEHIDGFKVSPNVIASWDDFAEWADPDPRDSYRAEARASIAAYLAARAAKGWREMPREPTAGMREAAGAQAMKINPAKDDDWRAVAFDSLSIYRAMFDAAGGGDG